MRKILIMMLFLSNSLYARPITVDSDHDAEIHHLLHFSVSYVIQDVTQRLMSKAFGMPRIPAFFFGLVLSNCVGISYKMLESSGPVNDFGNAMLYNNLGNLSAGLTFVVFKF